MKHMHTSLFLLFVTASLLLFSQAHSAEIDIQAQTLEYDEANKYMIAKDSVTISWEGRTIKAQSVQFWIEGNYLVAEGNIELKEKDNILYGDSIAFSLVSSSGTIHNSSGYADIWRFKAISTTRLSEKAYKIETARFTTCTLKNPHYVIRAKRATILPDKRIVIYNPVFFLRKVPVFYLPIFWQGFGPHRGNIEVQPGYNNSDGFISKIIYTYTLTEHSFTKLYFDYYSLRGIGKGAEYTYYIPDEVKGTIYGYHIKENTTESERYTLSASYWQKLSPLWTGQGEVNYVSDTVFNNSYFQNNWLQSSQLMRSNLSLTRQSGVSNLRFTSERLDEYDSATGEFFLKQLTLPKVEYTLFSQKRRMPFYYNASAAFQNQYNQDVDFYLLSSIANTSIYNSYRLGRNITITPSLGMTETWRDRATAIDDSDIFQTYLNSGLNLRYRPLYWMDWDFRHNYRIRSQVNSLEQDYAANDYGRETNSVSFQNSMYFNSVILRNSIGYNLRVDRGEIIEKWQTKLTPMVNELTWGQFVPYLQKKNLPRQPGDKTTPTQYIAYSLFIREESILYPYHQMNSLQTELSASLDEETYFGLGSVYRSLFPDQLDFNSRFGFWITDKWKIDYRIYLTSLEKLQQFRPSIEELTLYRDLHCWETLIKYRRRLTGNLQYANEIYFQIDLKTNLANKRTQKKIERELYPWR